MKRLLTGLSFFALISSACLAQSTSPRQTESLNYGWEFSRQASFADAGTVDVPHDFQIEQPWVAPSADEKADNSDVAANIRSRLSARGFKEIGKGYYRKTVTPPAEWKGRRVLLDFEGIMLVGDVFLNGKRIGGTDYGYVGFEIDVTDQLRYGQPNEIIVEANTMSEKASRWYTRGGLFRNVSMAMVGRGRVNCSESLSIEVANVSKTMAPIRNNHSFIT